MDESGTSVDPSPGKMLQHTTLSLDSGFGEYYDNIADINMYGSSVDPIPHKLEYVSPVVDCKLIDRTSDDINNTEQIKPLRVKSGCEKGEYSEVIRHLSLNDDGKAEASDCCDLSAHFQLLALENDERCVPDAYYVSNDNDDIEQDGLSDRGTGVLIQRGPGPIKGSGRSLHLSPYAQTPTSNEHCRTKPRDKTCVELGPVLVHDGDEYLENMFALVKDLEKEQEETITDVKLKSIESILCLACVQPGSTYDDSFQHTCSIGHTLFDRNTSAAVSDEQIFMNILQDEEKASNIPTVVQEAWDSMDVNIRSGQKNRKLSKRTKTRSTNDDNAEILSTGPARNRLVGCSSTRSSSNSLLLTNGMTKDDNSIQAVAYPTGVCGQTIHLPSKYQCGIPMSAEHCQLRPYRQLQSSPLATPSTTTNLQHVHPAETYPPGQDDSNTTRPSLERPPRPVPPNFVSLPIFDKIQVQPMPLLINQVCLQPPALMEYGILRQNQPTQLANSNLQITHGREEPCCYNMLLIPSHQVVPKIPTTEHNPVRPHVHKGLRKIMPKKA